MFGRDDPFINFDNDNDSLEGAVGGGINARAPNISTDYTQQLLDLLIVQNQQKDQMMATIMSLFVFHAKPMGMSPNIIREEFIKKNKLMCKPASQFLGGFGTGDLVESCWSTELKLKFDDICEDVEAFVVPNESQPMNVLIGRSFTELPHLAYIKKGDDLHFGYSTENPFKDI